MIFKIENEKLQVEINTLGAELWSMINKGDGVEHLWQGDISIWPRRSPVLFPHCGRLKGNTYKIDGEEYSSSIHGFARDYEHEVLDQSDTSITFLLNSNEETFKMYPYQFKLYSRYELEDNKLNYSFEVENCSDNEMLFSIGYHTGLMCPFDSTNTIEDYSLIFEKEETPIEILSDSEGFLTGEERVYFDNKKIIKLREKLFHNSIILSKLKSEHITLVEEGTGRSVKVNIKDFEYVVLWSMAENIKFICIEPWHGLPDMYNTKGNFHEKPGIKKISPGEQFTCTQTIEINR